MAKRKPGGKPFAKGKSGNPKGSSARSQSRKLKDLQKLTVDQVAEVGSMILEGNRAGLEKIGSDPEATVLQVWMAGLVVQSMTKGDATIFRAILDRIVGKPKESIELAGKDGGPLSVDVHKREMSEDEMRERADLLAKQRAAAGDD